MDQIDIIFGLQPDIEAFDQNERFLSIVGRWRPEYITAELTLAREDILFMFTDGIGEAMNKKGENFMPYLLAHLPTEKKSAHELSDIVFQHLNRFADPSRLNDDAALLLIKSK